MEYLWSVINPNDADRCTTVLDLKGVTLATSTKAEIIMFIKQAVTMMSTHYPEVRWSTRYRDVHFFGGFRPRFLAFCFSIFFFWHLFWLPALLCGR